MPHPEWEQTRQERTKSNPSRQEQPIEWPEHPMLSIWKSIQTNVKDDDTVMRRTLVSSFSFCNNLFIIFTGQRNSSLLFKTSSFVFTTTLLLIYPTHTIQSIPLCRRFIWRILEKGLFWLAGDSLSNRNGIIHYCLLRLSAGFNKYTESSDTIRVRFGRFWVHCTLLFQFDMKICLFLFIVLFTAGYELEGTLNCRYYFYVSKYMTNRKDDHFRTFVVFVVTFDF